MDKLTIIGGGNLGSAIAEGILDSGFIKPEQLMIGYNGIKYGAKRQNTLAATLLVQLQGSWVLGGNGAPKPNALRLPPREVRP